ncbi:MAG: hypothetical protein Q9218_006477 [Villophora microphyllina]
MTEPQEYGILVYPPMEYVENFNCYHPGGFHPVHLDDEFCNGRYRVVHKLGYGSYSVVWLARDQNTNQYVALKILRAAASPSSNESRILHILEQHRSQLPESQGGRYVAKLLDEFDIDGVNGQHKCLVSELVGYSIADSKAISCVRLFKLEVARAIAAKVILGVQFLHSSGIVHGDLHKGNIMLKIPNIDGLSTEELYQRFKDADKLPVERRDGKPIPEMAPSYAVPHMISSKACEEVTESDIIITDFGEAYVAETESRDTLNTPQRLLPPEMLLQSGGIGRPADIWALACTLVEIMGRKVLFETYFCDNDDVMAEIISCMGMPPESVWKAWEKRGEFFTEDGEWQLNEAREQNLDGVFRTLEWRIESRTKRDGVSLAEEERDAFVQMLRGMLACEPHKRWRIEDVVRSEWMEKYGKPAIEAQDKAANVDEAPETENSHESTGTLPEECNKLSLDPQDTFEDAKGFTATSNDPSSFPYGFTTSQTDPPKPFVPIPNPIPNDLTTTAAPEKTLTPNPTPATEPSADPSKGYQTPTDVQPASPKTQSESTTIPTIHINTPEDPHWEAASSAAKETSAEEAEAPGSSSGETITIPKIHTNTPEDPHQEDGSSTAEGTRTKEGKTPNPSSEP